MFLHGLAICLRGSASCTTSQSNCTYKANGKDEEMQLYILFYIATVVANGDQKVKCASGQTSQKYMHSLFRACFCIYLCSFLA